MPRMSTITATLMITFRRSMGFQQVRQKGSHKFFKHPDGRTATVPDHKEEDLGCGITGKILKDAEVAKKNFMDWCSKR